MQLMQMHVQETPRQYAGPQQSNTYSNYDAPDRPIQQQQVQFSSSQHEYANPHRQQSDPRLYQPPPGQQRPMAHTNWAEQSQSRDVVRDQSQGAYGQMPTGRRPQEPFSNPQPSISNDPSEFGMGRRGRGQNDNRGLTPPPNFASTGTGAASVMALGQNKLPQRAEVLGFTP